GIKDLKISTSQKKSWLTLEDIKIATMSLRDKQLLLKMIIGLIIFGVPTGYFVWNFISVVDDWDRIMHANDIFMYMG
ncbi:hypothetical protein WL280_14115, partial [Staphylococcus epidermidis]